MLIFRKKSMLVNLSRDFNEKREEINHQIGKAFSLEERKQLEGTNLPNLSITAASIEIYNLLVLNQGQNNCNLEMRPKGVMLSFRAGGETYSLVIPFYKLKIYKGRSEEYSFYKDNHFIKVKAGAEEHQVHAFIRKLRHYKAEKALPRVDDQK